MSVRGFIDGVADRELIGWVVDEADPQRLLSVNGWLDGVALGSAVADEPRADLLRAGIGDGTIGGFRISLPGVLTRGEHGVGVTVDPDGESIPLADDWVALEADVNIEGVWLRESRDVAARPTPPPAPSSPARPASELPTAPSAVGGGRELGEALLGEADWLYEHTPAFDRIRGVTPLAHAELDARVEELSSFHATARAAGAVAVAACLPDKLHVYAEHRPAGLELNPEGRAAARIAARLRAVDDADLLDLLPVLRDARDHGRVFPRTSPNVTWVGAFHAYRAIAKALAWRRPGVELLAAEALSLGALADVVPSLAGGPAVVWTGRGTTPVTIAASPPRAETEPLLGDETGLNATESSAGVWERRDGRGLGSAVIVTAPGGERVARLLAELFRRSRIMPAADAPPDRLAADPADVYIQLVSDRWLSE